MEISDYFSQVDVAHWSNNSVQFISLLFQQDMKSKFLSMDQQLENSSMPRRMFG